MNLVIDMYNLVSCRECLDIYINTTSHDTLGECRTLWCRLHCLCALTGNVIDHEESDSLRVTWVILRCIYFFWWLLSVITPLKSKTWGNWRNFPKFVLKYDWSCEVMNQQNSERRTITTILIGFIAITIIHHSLLGLPIDCPFHSCQVASVCSSLHQDLQGNSEAPLGLWSCTTLVHYPYTAGWSHST